MRALSFWIVALGLSFVAAPQAEQILGGKPAALTTVYKTEREWAVRESVEDIIEMAASVRGSRPLLTVPADVIPWTIEAFVPLAAEAFGAAPPQRGAQRDLPAQYPVLLDLTAASIVRASDAASDALRQNMRNAQAHESAALVLAAFGLREAAEEMTDVRWALNRMTAHLAIADALRGPDRAAGADGQLARVAFLALSNRSATGLKALDQIAGRPDDPRYAAWLHALRMRLTDDWRISPAPAKAPRIEKLEYFRARRKTIGGRAGEELTRLMEPPAIEFARIVASFPYGVEDGNDFVEPALGAELIEISEVHRLVEHSDLPPTLPDAIINARAGRLMTGGRPRVIPWGAWAEFFQRHSGMYVGEVDDFYRKMLGSPGRADQMKPRLDALLGHLTLFPIASTKRTKGRGLEADSKYLNDAIALTARAPELVTYTFWSFLENGARYEVVKSGMPERGRWFAQPSAAVPYDAGIRIRYATLSTPEMAALVAEAATERNVHARALMPRPNAQQLWADVRAWLKMRADYDLYSLDTADKWARTPDEQLEARRRACELSVSRCPALARTLAWMGDEAGAIREYERAFKDPGLDQVAFANSSAWLVSFYETHGQLDRAYDLAQRSAAVGSAPGLETLARLYERRNRLDEALPLYERIAGRYERANNELAGFLYRQAILGKHAEYMERWRAIEHALFPSGLQPIPATMPDSPEKGVFIYDESSMSRQVRLQAGDIIVGLDGWRVENKEQYDAVMSFTEPDAKHKITAWRGVLLTVELPEANGMELQTYPLRGWIQ